MEYRVNFDEAEDLECLTINQVKELIEGDVCMGKDIWLLDLDHNKMWFTYFGADGWLAHKIVEEYFITHSYRDGVLTTHTREPRVYVRDII